MSRSAVAPSHELVRLIDETLDLEFLEASLIQLVQSPSDVPTGEIAIEPDDPKIGHYVKEVVQPILEQLQLEKLMVDGLNNLVGSIGPDSSDSSLLMVGYSVSQHANRMEHPYSGQIASGKEFGRDEPCVFGKGASQNKGALAALLAALKLLRDQGLELKGKLFVVLNSEGQSSHRCMEQIFTDNRLMADGGILCVGTGNRISLGNRGRVDVYITVRGKSAHSSQPWLGINAIDGLREVLGRLRDVKLDRDHPILGKTQLTVYNLACTPSSPHTIPDRCRAIVDRRILPGEDIDSVVDEIRDAVGELDIGAVDVEMGPYMFPALVDPKHPLVQTLEEGFKGITGQPAQTFYPDYTFDAGFPCLAGVPTVMFGPSSWADITLGEEIVQTEFVALSQVVAAAKTYAYTILKSLG
ncbi:MAG: M20 family metallopeptidase [Anaerolineales bacterium]